MEKRRDERGGVFGRVADAAPPYAPMSMPDQVLERTAQRGLLLARIRNFLAWG